VFCVVFLFCIFSALFAHIYFTVVSRLSSVRSGRARSTAPDGSRLLTRVDRETKVSLSVRWLLLHIPGLTRTSQSGRLETAFPEKWPAGCTVWSSDGDGALCTGVLEQTYKTVTGILSSYRCSVRLLDARGIVRDSWELKRVSWIHDMVDTAHGERFVVVGETESRGDRYSIAECAIVGMWQLHLTLILA